MNSYAATTSSSVSGVRATSSAPPNGTKRNALGAVSTTAKRKRKVKIPRRELLGLTSQLSIMTRTGLDIASALESLARQTRRPEMKAMLRDIHADVASGNRISEALENYVEVFGKTYTASVAAGEASGRLPDVLGQLARLQKSEIQLRSKVVTILAYPIILTAVSNVVLMALVLFVLPQFATIFNEQGMTLPLLTKVLLGVSTELRTRIWLWAGLLLAAIVGLVMFRRSEAGKQMWHNFLLNAFLLRDVVRPMMIGRVSQLLAIMLSSGIPLLDSLRLTRSAISNAAYKKMLRSAENNIVNGRGLGQALQETAFVPPGAAEMLLTAERTGSMTMVAELIGEYYEEEGEAKMRELAALFEPAIIVVMGVFVAGVVLSVMLPLIDLSTAGSPAG